MCDPISVAVVGVCCCCICVAFIAMAATIGPMLAEVASAVTEVVVCVNDTLGKPILDSLQEDHCKQHTEKKCPEVQEANSGIGTPSPPSANNTNNSKPAPPSKPIGFERRLNEKPSGEVTLEQECQILQAKCMCDIAVAITAAEDEAGFAQAKLKARLSPCCATFEEYEEHPVFGEFAKPAGDMCKEMVHNVTTLIDEVATNCSRGELPTILNPDDFTGGGGGASPFQGGFSEKFFLLEDVLSPPSALANKVQPLATAGAGVILLVAAAAIGLRRRGAGHGMRQALVMEVEAPGVE